MPGTRSRPPSDPVHPQGRTVGSNCKSLICGNPKLHSFGLSVTAHRAAMLAEPTERERCANAWMGDQDVVEVLFGTGRLEGGAVERFGVNRRTIHHWVKTGQLDRDLSAGARGYAPRPPMTHKLDPYKGIIDARLEAFPKLSAKRLFDEVCAAGYPGGYRRVLDYVRAARPREPVEAPVRFETPAGRQGQVDFGTFTLPWGRRHALVIVLGYSRLLWLRF